MGVDVVGDFGRYVTREAFWGSLKSPKPHPPEAAYFLESLTMVCIFTGEPATKACTAGRLEMLRDCRVRRGYAPRERGRAAAAYPREHLLRRTCSSFVNVQPLERFYLVSPG